MKASLKILIIEDSEDDALLEVHEIKKSGCDVIFECIDTAEDLKLALREKQWDLILADYSMPMFNGLEALNILKETGLDIPFIIISGKIGEEVAVEAMKAGAHDYIMKNNLKRLIPAIEREIHEAEVRLERNILEQKRKDTEKRLKVLSHAVEQSPVMVIITDKDGIIEYLNPKFIAITGFSGKDLIGSQYSSFVKDKKYGDNNLGLREYLEVENIWKGEIQKQKKDGSLFWTSISISPIKDDRGLTVQYVIIEEDISNKKKTEQELIIAKEKAEESDQLKTAFLQNMSHEIRTPMNAIMGFAELLVDKNKDDPQKRDYAQIVQNSSNNLLNVIDSILDIAKIESGQLTVYHETCDINELFEELFILFRGIKSRLQKDNIELMFKSTYETLNIKTDPVKLKQILINLLSNALKFTEEGSIEVGYIVEEEHTMVFYVDDTGRGIPEDMYEKIFQQFFKINQRNQKFLEGTGLGLAIVKELLDLLGGKIWLESKLGVGSRFYFSLPCKIL